MTPCPTSVSHVFTLEHSDHSTVESMKERRPFCSAQHATKDVDGGRRLSDAGACYVPSHLMYETRTPDHGHAHIGRPQHTHILLHRATNRVPGLAASGTNVLVLPEDLGMDHQTGAPSSRRGRHPHHQNPGAGPRPCIRRRLSHASSTTPSANNQEKVRDAPRIPRSCFCSAEFLDLLASS